MRVALLLLALLLAPMASRGVLPGDVDTFNPKIVGSPVWSIAVQPDGKFIVAGVFTSAVNAPRGNIARYNANGTLDFNFYPTANGSVATVAVQPDGKILMGGGFTTLQPNGSDAPTTRLRLARLQPNGSLDLSFDPAVNGGVYCITLQRDGKILIGGDFTTVQGHGASAPVTRNRIARLNPDGSLDLGFDPEADGRVNIILQHPDGRIITGGYFTTLKPNGAATAIDQPYLARLNDDGTLDSEFTTRPSFAVLCLAVQPDGKILMGGGFAYVRSAGATSSISRPCLARINEDGTLDEGFDPHVSSSVYSLALQADGKVIVGGYFTRFQPNGGPSPTTRNRIARIYADGSLDEGFDPNANDWVQSVALQADGKALVGGDFTRLVPNGATVGFLRDRLARLYNDPVLQTLAAPETTRVLWTRGGAAPEVWRVTFELSTNGGTNWTPLGNGARVGVTSNWELTDLALPTTGMLRARGSTSGGIYNASTGLIEQVSAFDTTPYGQWKLAELGSVTAPDAGNPDADALMNLAEYGLVQSPTAFSTEPVGERFGYPDGERLRMVFPRDPARPDVTIEVLASDSLEGPWETIASSVLGGVTSGPGYYAGDGAGLGVKQVEVRDVFPIGDPAHPQRFLRLRVSR